jgi:hypothetical protein
MCDVELDINGCSIGQQIKCNIFGCQWQKSFGQHCSGRPKLEPSSAKIYIKKKKKKRAVSTFSVPKNLISANLKEPNISNAEHIWIGKLGVEVRKGKDLKPIDKKAVYMGYTFSIGYPKKMNTGRIIYKDPVNYNK